MYFTKYFDNIHPIIDLQIISKTYPKRASRFITAGTSTHRHNNTENGQLKILHACMHDLRGFDTKDEGIQFRPINFPLSPFSAGCEPAHNGERCRKTDVGDCNQLF